MERTDACINSSGKIVKEKVVVLKVKKPGQDFRLDLPATGIKSIGTHSSVNGAVLAVEAGQSLLFDPEAMIRAAEDAGIVVVGVTENPDGTLAY
mgnify:CR=1 FL=1